MDPEAIQSLASPQIPPFRPLLGPILGPIWADGELLVEALAHATHRVSPPMASRAMRHPPKGPLRRIRGCSDRVPGWGPRWGLLGVVEGGGVPGSGVGGAAIAL